MQDLILIFGTLSISLLASFAISILARGSGRRE